MGLDDEARRIREETRKNFPGMPLSKKCEYIWMYYKWVFVLLFIALLLSVGVSDWIRSAKTEHILGILAVNCGPGYTDEVGQTIRDSVGGEGKYEAVEVFPNAYADPETGEFDYNSQISVITFLSAGEIDVVLTPDAARSNFTGAVSLADLPELLGTEGLSEKASFDGPYLVLEEGSTLYELFGFAYSPVYVGLLEGCKNEETALDWLRQIAGITEQKP